MNTFYHGDCLFVMNHDIPPESVDLIYLDPPFFTGKKQTGIAKWKPGEMPISYEDGKQFWKEKGVASHAPEWLKHLAHDLDRPDFAAYLFYMMERLEACHTILKETGSIYLHCDWRASHYLKMIMDEIFGDDNFRNEIIWHYRGRGMQRQRFQRKHDTIFYYAKTAPVFNAKDILVPLDPKHISRYNKTDEGGNPYALIKGHNGDYSKIYRKDGIVPDDVWDIPFIHGNEAIGYPTQKPLDLLKRIIKASSNEGDTILDPFCGCGTAIIAAHDLRRYWIGVDISSDAYEVTISRKAKAAQHRQGMDDTFSYIERDLNKVNAIKKPQGKDSFEEWVNEFYKARKPQPDEGVDGITQDGIPIQTKTYTVTSALVRKLFGDAQLHPQVKQPCKHVILVSQRGFDDSARRQQDKIQLKEGVKVDLLTPTMMLSNNGVYKEVS